MSRMNSLILCLLVLPLFLGGCFRIAYHVGDAPDKTYTMRSWNNFFLAGLAPVEESRNLETLCPGSKILEVKTFVSPANALSGIVSFGMSSGTSLEYTCAFPEDRLSRSAGRIRDSILSRLGLDGEPQDEGRRNQRPNDEED
jgi:hypothetical protein